MNGVQSALDPAGPQAARIAHLWWVLLGTAAVVYVIVMVVLAAGIWRGRRGRAPADDRRMTRVVGTSVGLTAVILLGFLVAATSTGRALATVPAKEALLIQVTGHQWWWGVQYIDTAPSRRLTTANEIYVPVGRPVQLELQSRDVIHSFWVPNLHGKRDLIPGNTTPTWFQADTAGVYRGQCAEFCGFQHAKMALEIVAVPEAQFERWYAAQLQSPPPPTDTLALRGREVFMASTCVMCHSIAGTIAQSRVGPDLSHVGSRRSIGAGTLPNDVARLAGWIENPQRIKPGVKMPPAPLSPADVQAVAAYLASLR